MHSGAYLESTPPGEKRREFTGSAIRDNRNTESFLQCIPVGHSSNLQGSTYEIF